MVVKILKNINEIGLELLALKSDCSLKDVKSIEKIDKCANILKEILLCVKELDSFMNPKCNCSNCLSHSLGHSVKSIEDYYKED